jgi:predicted nucleic acid-binding protein
MIYFDAAYIAKCYLNEPGAEPVRKLAQGTQGVCSSELGRLEFACAVQRHRREGHINAREARQALANFKQDEESGVWHWLPITSALIGQVWEWVNSLPKEVFLRAGDAIHLGCAREHGFREIYTSDRHMLGGARHFGLVGIDVLELG